MDDIKRKHINCHKCRHYYVTWDRSFPHGCRAMDFKSKEFPSVAVYRNSGTNCLMYSPKPPSRPDAKKKLTA